MYAIIAKIPHLLLSLLFELFVAAGFISGSGFSMLNGYPLSQSLLNGVKGAGIGFLVGGALGGLAQGISDLRHGGNFWTGKGTIEEFSGGVLPEDLKVKLGEGMEYSNEYAHSFSNRHFSKWEKFVRQLYADGTIPGGMVMKCMVTM